MLENNHGEEPNVKCPSCKDLFDIMDLSSHYEGSSNTCVYNRK